MKKLILVAIALLAVVGMSEAKTSGNFYIDSYVQTMTDNGANADYDGQDIVMTVSESDPEFESSLKAVGTDAVSSMLKEQLLQSFKGYDPSAKMFMEEIAKAGCGIKIHYVCGSQTVDVRVSPKEILAEL